MTHVVEPELEEVRDAIWPRDRRTEARVVRCRHCARRNRVSVPDAVLAPQKLACGRCGGALFFGRDEPLADLPSEAYQHGLDRRSLAALRSIPGVPQMVRWMYERVGDRTAQLIFTSDAIQCGPDQFPELLRVLERARRRIDFRASPAIYLGESPHMNAMTTGVREPIIVVRSALLDQVNDDELLAIIGHELGHLHADHPLYHSVASALVAGSSVVSPAVRVLSLPIQRLLLRWLRHSELTADRAALLVARDLRVCISVMLTFAGGNRPGTSRRTRMRLAPFIRQCRELASAQAGFSFDGVVGSYLDATRTHPHVAARVTHLIQWVEHGNYLDILAGNYVRRAQSAPRSEAPDARADEEGAAQ